MMNYIILDMLVKWIGILTAIGYFMYCMKDDWDLKGGRLIEQIIYNALFGLIFGGAVIFSLGLIIGVLSSQQ